MRDLENRAGNLASMLRELVVQGEGARSLVRQALLANGNQATAELAAVERISCTPELYLGVCRVMERWVSDVRAELEAATVEGTTDHRALPPRGRR